MRRSITTWLFIAYAIAVVAVTVFPLTPLPPPPYRSGEPWWTMVHYIPFEVEAASFVLNVIMFVPFGVLVPLLWPSADGVGRLASRAVAVSCGIELVQLVLDLTLDSRRTVDVNDLLANTLGALAGLVILRSAVPDRADRRSILDAAGRRQ